jgi:hypothetical protein
MISLRPSKSLRWTSPILGDPEYIQTAMLLISIRTGTVEIECKDPFSHRLIHSLCQKLNLSINENQSKLLIQGNGTTPLPQNHWEKHSGFKSLLGLASFLTFHLPEFHFSDVSELEFILLKPILDSFGISTSYLNEKMTLSCIALSPINESKLELNEYQPWIRNQFIWKSLIQFKEFQWKERFSVHEHLFNLAMELGHTGVKIAPNQSYQNELERRLAKLRVSTNSIKINQFKLSPQDFPIALKEIKIPTDCALASTISLLAILCPDSEVEIPAVWISPSRTRFFTIAKKMGAQIETLARREVSGETWGNLKCRYSKNLHGKKIAGEELIATIDEWPLIAILACFCEGETIIRDFSQLPSGFLSIINHLILNLKKTGVDIAIFEDGLVIRGRSEIDGAEFDAAGLPILTCAFYILGKSAKGGSKLINPDLNTLQRIEYLCDSGES